MSKRTSSGLTGVATAEILKELTRRRRGLGTLQRKRARLAARLHAVEAQIAALGGDGRAGAAGRGRRGGRPRNSMSLVEALSGALKGKTMSVQEAMDAVQRAGYKTTSPSFRVIVNQALIASGKFRRVSRGKYTAK